MALQLYLNNEAADLPANARVRLNQGSNAAEQLDVRIGERSYGFTLPPTRTNDRLFAHARQQLQLRKFNRTTDLTARLVADGVDVLPSGAVCRLNAAGRDGFDITLYAPGVTLGEALAAKSLRELTTLPPRYFASLSELQEIIAADSSTEVLAAPLVSYGNWFSSLGPSPITGTMAPLWAMSDPIQLDDYALSTYASRVLEAIFAEQGYRIEGSPLRNPDWLATALPYTHADAFPWPWGVLGETTAQIIRSNYAFNVINGDPCELLTIPDPVVYDGPSTDYNNYRVIIKYVAQTADTYVLTGQWTFNGPTGDVYGAPNAFEPVPVRLTVIVTDTSGGEVVTDLCVGDPTNPYSIAGTTISETFEVPVAVPGKGSTITVIVPNTRNYPGISGGTEQYQWESVTCAITIPDAETLLRPERLLPQMSQKDFVKAFLTLTNSTFELDEQRKVVSFRYRDILTAQQRASALDLDAYIDPAAFQYRPAGLFKTVEFAYAEDSKDVVATSPAPLGGGQGAGWADATVPLAAVGRTDTKTITVPFAATATRAYTRWDTTDLRVLPTIADEEHLNQLRIESDWSYDYTPRLLRLGEVTDSSDQIEVGTRTTVTISYRPSTSYPTWSELVDQRYATTLELLDASELVTAEILLTPTLYRELRPGRVVCVNGVVYTVNKLDGYEPGSTRPATIELLRYLPPSGRL